MMHYRPHRYNTQFPTKLITPTGPQQAQVIDVNNTGARITGISRLARGDKLQLDVLNYKIDAIVRWVAGGRAGIVFRPQIGDDQVDVLRKRPNGRSGHRRGAVGFGFQEMR